MLGIFDFFASLSRVNVFKVGFYIFVTLALHALFFKNYNPGSLIQESQNHDLRKKNKNYPAR